MSKKNIKNKSDLYSVVRFNEHESKLFECIPELWFTDDKKTACYWPPKGKSFRLRALNKEKPDSTWIISECIFVSGGYVTYNDGLSAAKEKVLEQNTSSADDQLEVKKFRRKHPVLALSVNKNFEHIFSEPTLQENNKTGVGSTETVVVDVAGSRRRKAAPLVQKSNKRIETAVMKKGAVNAEPEEQSTQFSPYKSPVGSIHSRRLSSDFQLRGLSLKSGSRSRDVSHVSGHSSSSSSKSRRSHSRRSDRSKSRSTELQRSGCSSRSRYTDSRRFDRSRSRHSSRGSGHSSRGSGHSSRGSGPTSRGSGHSGRGSRHSSRESGRFSRGSERSSHGSGHFNREHSSDRSRSPLLPNFESRSHSRSSRSTSKSPSRPQLAKQSSRTANHHHNRNSNRNQRNSRSYLRRTESDARSIDAFDRRMTRMEVTINKIFVMVSDIIKHSNKDIRSQKENRANAIERRPPNRFEEPDLPISRSTQLTVFNKMLKRREVYSFMLEQEKEFCAPSKSSDNVVMTAYLKRFIAVELRCKIALKDTKGQKHLTLFSDFHRVYNFLIDVMKSGYAAYNKRIKSTEVHTALRTVWGRSNQLLQDKNRRNYK